MVAPQSLGDTHYLMSFGHNDMISASFPNMVCSLHRDISVGRDVHTEAASDTSPDNVVSLPSNPVEVPRAGLRGVSSHKGNA